MTYLYVAIDFSAAILPVLNRIKDKANFVLVGLIISFDSTSIPKLQRVVEASELNEDPKVSNDFASDN